MAASMTPDYFWALLVPNTSQTLHSINLGVMSCSFDRKSRKDWKHLFCIIRFYSQENLFGKTDRWRVSVHGCFSGLCVYLTPSISPTQKSKYVYHTISDMKRHYIRHRKNFVTESELYSTNYPLWNHVCTIRYSIYRVVWEFIT